MEEVFGLCEAPGQCIVLSKIPRPARPDWDMVPESRENGPAGEAATNRSWWTSFKARYRNITAGIFELFADTCSVLSLVLTPDNQDDVSAPPALTKYGKPLYAL